MRKEYWVFLACYLISTPLIVYAWKTMADRENAWDILGIWLVSCVVGIVQLALVHWRPRQNSMAHICTYLVLGPLSLMAWFTRSFDMWFVVPFALAGVLILWFAAPAIRPMREPNGSFPDPGTPMIRR